MKYYLLIVLSFFSTFSFAQPNIQWQKCYGSLTNDAIIDVINAHNVGYISCGYTTGCAGGSLDAWIIRTDNAGNILWQKCYGGSGSEKFQSICKTMDGGYVLVGTSNSNDGDVTGVHGSGDFWVVKIDSAGTIKWQKALGGTLSETGRSIQQTSDGGYMVAGITLSNNGDVTGNHGTSDYWVVKLSGDDFGNTIVWQKALGSSGDDFAYGMTLTPDGGCIIVGRAGKADGDVSQAVTFGSWWIVKLSSTGVLQWEKSHLGKGADEAFSVANTFDGGYIITGTMNNNTTAPNQYHGLLKLTSNGTMQWSKPINGQWVIQTADSGYAVISTQKGQKTQTDVSDNYFIRKLDVNGDSVWLKVVGGSANDKPTCILQTVDGGYLAAGLTLSNDWDVSGNNGASDGWMVKLGFPSSGLQSVRPIAVNVYPNPTNGTVYFSESVNLQVMNLMGEVLENKRNVKVIQMDDKPNGIYLLRFYNDRGIVIGVKQLMKK